MFIAAKSDFIQSAMDVQSTEAPALRMGWDVAEHLGIHSIESDWMEVVQTVLNPVVIDDCRKKMSDFGGATIGHCNGEAVGSSFFV
jgi:hypothetical protein